MYQENVYRSCHILNILVCQMQSTASIHVQKSNETLDN